MASCTQSRLVVTCQPGSANYRTLSGRLELVLPFCPFFACRGELIAWRMDGIANEMPIARCVWFRSNVWPKKKVVGPCALSEGRSAALDRVSRNSTASPRCDTRVCAATHGASYCVRRDVHRKAGCPDTFGIAFASMQYRGLGRNGFAPEPKSGVQRKQSAKRYRS